MGHGVVACGEESGEGLALMKAFCAPGEQKPLVPLLSPCEGLHTRHTGDRDLLKYDPPIAEVLRHELGQGEGQKKNECRRSHRSRGFHKAALRMLRAP